MKYGNGIVETFAFDSTRYWLEGIAGGPLSVTYEYEPVGNVRSADDARSGFDQWFTYDKLDRLRFVTGFGANEFGYDTVGNRTFKKIDGFTPGGIAYTYDANGVLDSISGNVQNSESGDYTFTHGNLVASRSRTYSYTPFNMLQTTVTAGVTTTYRYDGDGMRKARQTVQGTNHFIHGQGNELLSEFSQPAGAPLARWVRDYIYLGSRLVAAVSTVAGSRRPADPDFDGDGKADLSVYRPSDGSWLTVLSSLAYNPLAATWYFWGAPTDIPLIADFDGDGKQDLVTYSPSGGMWHIRYSSKAYSESTADHYQWGLSTDVPLSADFDGDGRTDLVVWRPSDGGWYIRLSSKGYSQAQWVFYDWGRSDDIPLAADFDGDGKTDLVAWRPSDGTWNMRLSSTGYNWDLWQTYQWGLSTDIPRVRDIDGDGKTDLVVWRPSDGGWYVRLSSKGYSQAEWMFYQWGLSTDQPLKP